MQQIKYDTVKQIKTDKGDNIVLTKKVYSQDTGELDKEIEFPFDTSVIPDRIAALQAEISNLEALQTKVETESFDTVEDNRSKEMKNA